MIPVGLAVIFVLKLTRNLAWSVVLKIALESLPGAKLRTAAKLLVLSKWLLLTNWRF